MDKMSVWEGCQWGSQYAVWGQCTDIEQESAVVSLIDNVVLKDLVVEGSRRRGGGGHGWERNRQIISYKLTDNCQRISRQSDTGLRVSRVLKVRAQCISSTDIAGRVMWDGSHLIGPLPGFPHVCMPRLCEAIVTRSHVHVTKSPGLSTKGASMHKPACCVTVCTHLHCPSTCAR